MNVNKIVLLSFLCLMPFGIQSSSNENLPGKVCLIALAGPAEAVLKGCQRRTLEKKEAAVIDKLTAEERSMFEENYISEKINTKPFTIAGGSLTPTMIFFLLTRSPLGVAVACTGVGLGVGALLLAAKGQAHNDVIFNSFMQSINTSRATKGQEIINSNAGLNNLEKMLFV